ncbi:MAG: copper amine oxidase N-terminal domain-containing protein, partial [Ignavibacteriales bacterium]
MRIWIRSIVLGLAFLLSVLALPNIAEASTATFQVNQKSYTVDDHDYTMDAAPYIKSGRLYVPIRYVALVCGLKAENIKYDKTTRVLTLVNDNGIETMLMVGAKRILINGIVSDTDAAPQMVKGRLYVPVRQIALAFQHKLYWDDKKKLLTIDIGNYLPEALDDIE